MGVDIKLFIEIDYSADDPAFCNAGNIRSLANGEFFVKRNYDLFLLLVGGNQVHENGYSAPRGLPSVVSEVVYYRYYHIVDEKGYGDGALDNVSASRWLLPIVSEESAQQWVKLGLSHFAPESYNAFGRRKRRRVSCADWKNASWLSANDLICFFNHLPVGILTRNADFSGIVSAATELAQSFGSERVRAVFWFDNELPSRSAPS